MTTQKQIDYIQKHYGYAFPLKAKYKRFENRIYFETDFKDGEEIEFFYMCDKPGAAAAGYAFYKGKSSVSELINIDEIQPI